MDEVSLLKCGVGGFKEIIVADEHLASKLGAHLVQVLSTPTMIAFMESTAADSVQPLLPSGHSTVGARVDIRHLAATAPGMRVQFQSELVEVDGRNLAFKVWADDERERIGEGMHYRVIIDRARFEAKLAKKAAGT